MLKYFIFSIFWIVSMVLTSYITLPGTPNKGELHNKREWSILQTVESTRRRAALDQGLVFYTEDKYGIPGIISRDSNQRVWLMTNAVNIPRIKIMPSLKPRYITRGEFDEISSRLPLNEETQELQRILVVNPSSHTPVHNKSSK